MDFSRLSKRNSSDQLIGQYKDWVCTCCRNMGLRGADLEDVAHNVMLKAWQALPAFRRQAELKSWLWRIARNETVNFFRRRRREIRNDTFSYQTRQHLSFQDPADLAEEKDLACLLRQAVHQLPNAWATAIRMFYWDQKSIRTIAESLKVTPSAVRIYLFRGRHRIREQMLSIHLQST